MLRVDGEFWWVRESAEAVLRVTILGFYGEGLKRERKEVLKRLKGFK